jgi:hypothetical protein
MTTMFEPFFGIPQAIVRLGKVKSLSGVAVKLYMVLLHQSERYRTRMLRCTTAELEELTGCSRNALTKARADLAHARLVQVQRRGEQGFILHLCDPERGEPWPGDPKQRIRAPKKDNASGPTALDVARAAKPRIDSEIEDAAFKQPRSENDSFRGDSAVTEHPMTTLASPTTSWAVVELIGSSYEMDLDGTKFPFGYNAPASCKPGSNPVMESLRGVFD